MVEEFLKNHWLFLINIPIFVISVGSILVLLNTYNRYVRISKSMRMKFLSDIEKEKRTISQELHDSISSFTILLKDYFTNSIQGDNERKEWLKEIYNFEKNTSNLNENIYPSEFLEGNLYTALQSYIKSFRKTNLDISLWIRDQPNIPSKYGIQIYRIIQESVVNIAKHTDSQHLTIFINQDKNLLIIVLNYSSQPNSKYEHHSGKRGRKIIDERIQIVNGQKELISNEESISEKYSFKIVKQ
jgi:signal transduction histidine kinase